MIDLSIAMELVQRNGSEWCDCALGYGEPGYSDPESGIIFADWNRVPRHIQEGLERRGFALEWCGEWLIDYEGGSKAYRSSPTHCGWTPSYILNDWTNGEIIPHSAILGDASLREEYIDDYLVNNPSAAAFAALDLEAEGFVKFNGTFESGFHPGQTDDPVKITEQIRMLSPDAEIVFQIADIGQFDISFLAYWRNPRSKG